MYFLQTIDMYDMDIKVYLLFIRNDKTDVIKFNKGVTE